MQYTTFTVFCCFAEKPPHGTPSSTVSCFTCWCDPNANDPGSSHRSELQWVGIYIYTDSNLLYETGEATQVHTSCPYLFNNLPLQWLLNQRYARSVTGILSLKMRQSHSRVQACYSTAHNYITTVVTHNSHSWPCLLILCPPYAHCLWRGRKQKGRSGGG